MSRASANGIDTYYEIHGDAAATVLFIHGGYGGAASTGGPLDRTNDMLACTPRDLVRTVIYDRRSAGRSSYVLEAYSQADLANDAYALLDHLQVDKAIIFGISAGGPIALQLALQYPERIAALALACTGSYLMRPRPRTETVKAQLEELNRVGDRAFFDANKDIRRFPAAPTTMWHPSIREAMAAHTTAVQAALAQTSEEDLFLYSTGEMRNLAAAVETDCTARLGELDVPTLIVHGTADSVVPFEWGQDLHKAVRGSEFHAIEGGDHGIFTWPEAQQIIRTWMEHLLATS